MDPFTPTPDQRRGRKRSLTGLLLLLLAAATLAATAFPWVDAVPWWAWLRPDAEAVDAPALLGGHDAAWWCGVLRPHVAVVALLLLVPTLLTKRLLSALLVAVALAVNVLVVGATPIRGGWPAAAATLMEEGPAGGDGWSVLHVHLAGADRLDALAAAVAAEQPDAVTAAGARPGVAQSITPLLDGYRLAGSRPAAGDDGLAVWIRRDVVSGAARPRGPTALAAELRRGDDRLDLVVATATPPAPSDDADADAPSLVVGGFDAPPWSLDLTGNPKLRLLPPGHARPWPPPLDHAWATLPEGWSALTAGSVEINSALFPLHRGFFVRLTPPR